MLRGRFLFDTVHLDGRVSSFSFLVATAVSVHFPFLPHDLSRIGLFSALYTSCCEHDSAVHALVRT
jgi:hypothetical protein